MTDYQQKLLESQLNSEGLLASIERLLEKNTLATISGVFVSFTALIIALIALLK